MGVSTHHVSEHVRASGIALGPRYREPVAVSGSLQRVDREHGVAGADQRLHPRAPVGLNPDHHLERLVCPDVLTDQRVQPSHSRYPFRQPGLGQFPSRGVHHLHVMVVFRPVIAHEQPHHEPVLSTPVCFSSQREDRHDLINSAHTTTERVGATSQQ